MKIYTILGASNGLRFTKNEQNEQVKEVFRAKYKLNENFNMTSLKKDKYINMFSLLLDNKELFQADEVIAIYTKFAQNKQQDMLKVEFDENFSYKFDEKYFIENENDFYEVLKVLNKVTRQTNEECILDLTHGFRHLPILATISLISQNFQSNKNIKYILFAKEFKKDGIDYEIIDLKEYLEIANLSIILENFSQNYTISSSTAFEDNIYQDIADDLRIISDHILANSFKKIYDDNTLENLINNLNNLKIDKKLLGFNFENILSHIKEIKSLENKKEYERFYELSKMLTNRGYLLNAITLLYEASRYFAIEILRKTSDDVSKSFDLFLSQYNGRKYYLLTDFASKFIQHKKVNRYDHSKNYYNQILNKKYDKILYNFINTNQNAKNLGKLISKLGKFRNNLAHGNENIKEDNAKIKLQDFQKKFAFFLNTNF